MAWLLRLVLKLLRVVRLVMLSALVALLVLGDLLIDVWVTLAWLWLALRVRTRGSNRRCSDTHLLGPLSISLHF